MKLGKLAARHDPRVPHLFKHMMLAKAAPSADWTKAVKAFSMLANERAGDCTAVGCLNLLRTWYANNGFDYEPTDDDALALYAATSNYPKEDCGAVEANVLKHWHDNGIVTPFGTDRILYASLNHLDLNELKLSVELFGGCYLGIALPLTAQTQEIWDVVPDAPDEIAAPGTWGGHCVVALAYDHDHVIVATWGKLLKVTPAFLQKYLDESWSVISTNWLADSGVSPSGLNWAGLEADLSSISG
jgi:hypothetical protein